MKININSVKWLFEIAFLLLVTTARGQQDPMFTQYYYNAQIINPAYTGTWESLGFLVSGRYQWVGMEGAPTTYTFALQAPMRNEKVALGLNVLSDKVGKEERFGLFGDYSYRVQLKEETFLRLGVQAGVSRYSNPLSTYLQNPDDSFDPSLVNDIQTMLIPNFGIGAYLYSTNYFLGFSVPKILETNFEKKNSTYSSYAEMRHFYLSGGYVFDLGPNMKFKPTFLGKVVAGAPAELDLTANFLLKQRVWLGAMYRTGDSFGFLTQWIFKDGLRLGYAVDFSTSRLRQYNNGTHELMISYELRFKKEKVVSPRYF